MRVLYVEPNLYVTEVGLELAELIMPNVKIDVAASFLEGTRMLYRAGGYDLIVSGYRDSGTDEANGGKFFYRDAKEIAPHTEFAFLASTPKKQILEEIGTSVPPPRVFAKGTPANTLPGVIAALVR